jgi:hypothetical protein
MVTEVESIGIPKQNGLGLEEERNGAYAINSPASNYGGHLLT